MGGKTSCVILFVGRIHYEQVISRYLTADQGLGKGRLKQCGRLEPQYLCSLMILRRRMKPHLSSGSPEATRA